MPGNVWAAQSKPVSGTAEYTGKSTPGSPGIDMSPSGPVVYNINALRKTSTFIQKLASKKNSEGLGN